MIAELGLQFLQQVAAALFLFAAIEAVLHQLSLPVGPMRRVFTRLALGSILLAVMGICWGLEDAFPLLDTVNDVLLCLGLGATLWGYVSVLRLKLQAGGGP